MTRHKKYDVNTPLAVSPTALSYRVSQGRTFKSTMTKLACGVYALLVSVAGFVFPISDALTGSEREFQYYSEIFSIYTYFMSLMFLAYLHMYLLRSAPSISELFYTSQQELATVKPPPNEQGTFRKQMNSTVDETAHLEDNEAGPDDDDDVKRVSDMSSINDAPTLEKGKSPLDVQFVNMRSTRTPTPGVVHESEGINFYLRLGAIVFGLGTMILNGFKISEYFGAAGAEYCESPLFIAVNILQLLFTFTQTFFIFKSHKVVIYKHKPFVRFGLMHLVATNICVWLQALVKESKETFKHLSYDAQVNGHASGDLEQNFNSCYAVKSLGDEASPYIYPFVIEYSLIAAAVMYYIYCNVGRQTSPSVAPRSVSVYNNRMSRLDSVSLATHLAEGSDVNCHKANRGLFLGLFVVMLTLVAMCLFFVFVEKMNNTFIAMMIYLVTEGALLFVGIFTVFFGMGRLTRLKFQETENGFFEDILLVVSLAGVYAYDLFVIIASIKTFDQFELHAYMMVGLGGLSLIQATIQTIFILDGLRRCADSDEHVLSKPGRCLVTFLLVCNLSMWLLSSFEAKKVGVSTLPISFYSQLSWTLISHLFTPLVIFFRFHSTACLAHIWQTAYVKKEKEL